MSEQVPPPEPPALAAMRARLERIVPAIWPLMVLTTLVTMGAMLFFFVMVWKNLTWGWDELSMSNTGNLGQFIAGTVGTAFTIITSLLLVITLWVQIHEFRLTREELVKTVEAQQEMAKNHEEQIQPLKDQANYSRQAMEMDLLTRAILDLKEDIRLFEARPQVNAKGCGEVMRLVVSCFNVNPAWKHLATTGHDPQKLHEFIGWSARAIAAFYVILERAELILKELRTNDLPEVPSLIRQKELILFVNNELRDLALPLDQMRVELMKTQGDDYMFHLFKEQATRQLKTIVDRLMDFIKVKVA